MLTCSATAQCFSLEMGMPPFTQRVLLSPSSPCQILSWELGPYSSYYDFPPAQLIRSLPAMQETWARSLGWEDPLKKEQQPTPVFLPGKSHGQRNLAGYSSWDCKESDTNKQLHFSSLHTMSSWLGSAMERKPRAVPLTCRASNTQCLSFLQ